MEDINEMEAEMTEAPKDFGERQEIILLIPKVRECIKERNLTSEREKL